MDTVITKQPKGIGSMFALQMFSMMGFSFVFSLLDLYCSTRLGFDSESTYAIVAAFNALAFAMSVPGGYIAQKFLGYRLGTWAPSVLCVLGLLLMAFPQKMLLYIGLGTFTFGTGMQLPCLYVLLGRLYSKNHSKSIREHGFMLAYISMNVGALIAMSLSGSIANTIGYSNSFIIG